MFTLAPDVRALQAACSAFIDACKCPLCGLPWRKASTFPCGHTFCYDCAIATLEGPGISQSECPKCKGKYWKRDLKPNPQMMAVVEHTQKILGIAAFQVTAGAACNSSGKAPDGSGAGCESPCKGCHGDIALSHLDQSRACTDAAATAAAAGEMQNGLKDGGAGKGSPGLQNTEAVGDRHRTAALRPAMADAAAPQSRYAEAAAKAAPRPCNPVDQGGKSQNAGMVTVRQWAEVQPTCTAAAPPGSAPGMPWVVQGARPLEVQGASRCDEAEPAAPECKLAYGESIALNTAEAHGAAAGLPHTSPALRTLSLDTGRRVLPAAARQETQHTGHVPLGTGEVQSTGRHSAEVTLLVPLPLRFAHGAQQGSAGQECCPYLALGGIASTVAVATPCEQLVLQPRSQAPAGWAAATHLNGGPTDGTGTGGAPPLRSSVVSIRRGTPSVNNAYLGFHALLEHPLGWISRPQPAGQRLGLAQASRVQADPSDGNDEFGEFQEAEWWLRCLDELAGPTDQEHEALEFELSIVNAFLEELGEMMAKHQQSGGRGDAASADGRFADAVGGGVADWDACLPSLSAGVGLPGEQSREARHAAPPSAYPCRGDATCTIQQVRASGAGPQQRADGQAAQHDLTAFDVFNADQLAAPARTQQPPKPHRAFQSLQHMDGDTGHAALTSGAVQASCFRSIDMEDRAAAAYSVPTLEGTVAIMGPRNDGADKGNQPRFMPRDWDKSSDQKQAACDSNAGGGRTSCSVAIGCDVAGAAAACAGLVVLPAACETAAALRSAHGSMAPNCTCDASNDDAEASRHGARCKRARTDAVSPTSAVPLASTPPAHIPESYRMGAVTAPQGRAEGAMVHESPLESPLGPSAAGLASGHKHGGEAVALCSSRGDGEATTRPDGAAAKAGPSFGASALQLPMPMPTPVVVPRAPSPMARSGDPKVAPQTNVFRRRDRGPNKRHRSEPLHPPLQPLSLNPQVPLQQQPQPQLKNAPASQRQARRAKVREHGSAAAAIAMVSPAPAPLHEPSPPGPSARRAKPLYVLPSGLGPEERARVKELTRSVRGLELLNEMQPQLTHLVVQLNADRRAVGRTIKYLRAVIQGCWVVGMDWVDACLAAGRLLPEGPFEATGDTTHAGTPATTRLRLERGDPPLFRGLKFCVMFLKGSFDRGITKPELEALLLAAGGTLVRRPAHRAGGGSGAAAAVATARVTAAAALFGAAAAADLYDAGPSTQQPVDGEVDVAGGSLPPPPGCPQVLVLVAPQTHVDVTRVLREWGCAPIQTQWVYDCISHYKLLPLEGFTVGLPSHVSTTEVF